MSPQEAYFIHEIDWHLKALRQQLAMLTETQHEHGPRSLLYDRMAQRFDRTLELAHGEFEYGIVALLDGRLPGVTEENDAANALGRENSQTEN